MNYKYLWAKKNRVKNQPAWLPLMVHLEDTSKVCALLYDRWLSQGVKDFLMNAVVTDEEDKDELLIKLCKFLGASHDLGKASPIFQVKKSFNGDKELDNLILENLIKSGFKDLDKYALENKENIAHNLISQYLLSKFGVNLCVSNIVGAHHGKPILEKDAEICKSFTSSIYQYDNLDSDEAKFWDGIQKNIFNWSLSEAEFVTPSDLPLISQPGQVILSGLLIMADWISSNEKFFPLIFVDQIETKDDRVENGFAMWINDRAENWEPDPYKYGLYKSRFKFIDEPRDAQRKISEEIHKIDNPGIVIIEAPMGLGKTETALIAVEDLAQKTNRTGMFFGLPTQATSNGIFSRVRGWLDHIEGEKSLRLIHGKAQLNDEFSKLPKSRNIHGEDGVGVNEWFAGRKVSILDDFTVGTVDQILLAALKQKHLMLRHLGLSNKVVVIDEVHAYDAYMSVFMYRALRWLGAYKVPVIILSATLPISKRNALLEEYMIGAGLGYGLLPKPVGFGTNEAYPLLTYNDGSTIKQFADFKKEAGKDYQIIKKSKEQSEDIVGLIKKMTPEGGVVGVIVNTVRKAQGFAKKSIEEFGEDRVELLHSSFIATDRYKKEKELIDTIGNKGNRPDFKIIIGTQVIEQSLDIDFDILITDLAPMDLILQRMGRLHRHDETKRPDNLKNPIVYVLNCGGYDFDEGSSFIYSPYILFRTEYYLPDKINLPNDISHLVQLVYSDGDLVLEEELKKIYKNYKKVNDKRILDKVEEASDYRIDIPEIDYIEPDFNIHELFTNSESIVELSDIKAGGKVRDSVDSVEVIALKKCEGGYEFFDKPGLLNSSDNNTAIEIAKRTIKLPNSVYYNKDNGYIIDKVIEDLEKYYLENLSNRDNQAWLKNSLGIIFDLNNEFSLGDKVLLYDKKFGLLVKKEEQNE
ncbi:CRISPR-associated helicase Cas3' [Anaerococcus sp. NML200537]|uniref:CRISPR-associated helicase Cas3' n=1 Tax=Anaerococcus sp. NML200537 TaxID=2954485 RepID=UPI0022372323|nr:CRISPR-associated helicase Cas3' [Anaerococcus sp. NML200537]MCW6700829.1 CRISPR-associated helicase Cas3' [Anaerococcus sp. NML200537]